MQWIKNEKRKKQRLCRYSDAMAIFAVFLLTIFLQGCGPEQTAAEETEGTAMGEDIIIANETSEETAIDIQDTAEAPEDTEAILEEAFDAQSMLPPMDGLLMCVVDGNLVRNMPYDGTDDLFFWSALLYTIGNYPGLSTQTQITETDYIVPSAVVQQYAEALFADARNVKDVRIPEELSGIPESGTAQVAYDQAEDAYHFCLEGRGLSYARIKETSELEDGSYQVITELCDVETDSAYAAARFELLPPETDRNQSIKEPGDINDLNGAADGRLFGYRICSMEMMAVMEEEEDES